MEADTPTRPPVISFYRMLQNLPDFVRNPIPSLNRYLWASGDTFLLFLTPGTKAMVTTRPELIQYVLQKNHRNYKKSYLQTEHLAHFIGRGLLTSNGAYWLQQRRLIQPGFHRKKLAGLMGIMNREIDKYLEQWHERARKGESVEIAHEMMLLTFNVVSRSLFSTGVAVSTLNRLSQNFNAIQSFIVKPIRQPYLIPWYKLTGEWKKHERIAADLKEIVLSIIRQRKQSEERHDDLLDMLLEARYEDTGEGMTDQQLLEECLILLVAGHETTANAMAWAWYLLGRHPEAVDKLRTEIGSVLGKKAPGFDTLPQLEYVNSVLQEVMRLYPPAWILDRIPIEDDEFEGLSLPKGRIIGLYIYGIHHDPQYWPEPEKFDPDRFTKDATRQRPSFAYLPFGGGPRLCIGANFAMMEMQMMLVRILQHFEMTLEQDVPVGLAPYISLQPDREIYIKLRSI
ncbi:cytochrome P450 [Flavilitoribacter nigricans]|uniref:Cytochrome P450 n=1 Tax=Flavilitoribacter nigricans (strain ATCC 23147 / DSM 23189 / NBRC 102662 / NCIMB 1420 / SS-2) TaxID=1122177 RepID=A0A2D0NBU3_FLAN2|nr:cytochrome P450 [Flavilitoribacter nigricans]PHN05957.1 cytochrome P450 [Flavilitoribacter nigricans DSM 23189 = NBRC 102662]